MSEWRVSERRGNGTGTDRQREFEMETGEERRRRCPFLAALSLPAALSPLSLLPSAPRCSLLLDQSDRQRAGTITQTSLWVAQPAAAQKEWTERRTKKVDEASGIGIQIKANFASQPISRGHLRTENQSHPARPSTTLTSSKSTVNQPCCQIWRTCCVVQMRHNSYKCPEFDPHSLKFLDGRVVKTTASRCFADRREFGSCLPFLSFFVFFCLAFSQPLGHRRHAPSGGPTGTSCCTASRWAAVHDLAIRASAADLVCLAGWLTD